MPESGRVAHLGKTRYPPTLRLIGVDGVGDVVQTTRVCNVVLRASNSALGPGVIKVKGQRRMRANARVQGGGR